MKSDKSKIACAFTFIKFADLDCFIICEVFQSLMKRAISVRRTYSFALVENLFKANLISSEVSSSNFTFSFFLIEKGNCSIM